MPDPLDENPGRDGAPGDGGHDSTGSGPTAADSSRSTWVEGDPAPSSITGLREAVLSRLRETESSLLELIGDFERTVEKEARAAEERSLETRLEAGEDPAPEIAEDVEPSVAKPPSPADTIRALRRATLRLDEADDQSELLSRLLEEATGFASRAALFLNRDDDDPTDVLRVWSSVGFSEGELADKAPVPERWRKTLEGGAGQRLDPEQCAEIAGLIGVDAGREGALVPFLVRDRVAAVLYADRTNGDQPFDPDSLQLLCHSAGLGLELVALRSNRPGPTLAELEVSGSEDLAIEEPLEENEDRAAEPEPEQPAPERPRAALPEPEPEPSREADAEDSEREDSELAAAEPAIADEPAETSSAEPPSSESPSAEPPSPEPPSLESWSTEPAAAELSPTESSFPESPSPDGSAPEPALTQPLAALDDDSTPSPPERPSWRDSEAGSEQPPAQQSETWGSSIVPSLPEPEQALGEVARAEGVPTSSEPPESMERERESTEERRQEAFSDDAVVDSDPGARGTSPIEPSPIEPSPIEPSPVEPSPSSEPPPWGSAGEAAAHAEGAVEAEGPPDSEPVDRAGLSRAETAAGFRWAELPAPAPPEIADREPEPHSVRADDGDTGDSDRDEWDAGESEQASLADTQPQEAVAEEPASAEDDRGTSWADRPSILETAPLEAAASESFQEAPTLPKTPPLGAGLEPPATTQELPISSAASEPTSPAGDVFPPEDPFSLSPKAPPAAGLDLLGTASEGAGQGRPAGDDSGLKTQVLDTSLFTSPATPPVPPPVSPPEPPAPASPPPGSSTEVRPPGDLEGPGWAFTARRDSGDDSGDPLHEEAKRLARLLVSEIKLYNEEQIELGRKQGNIYDALREDIDRSRRMYEERIDERVRDTTDYFRAELVKSLAGGDARVMGL